MDLPIVQIEAQTGLDLRVVGRLAGGDQGGAHLVAAGGGRRLVLKLQPEGWKAERLLRAAPVVDHAVRHGWPAARWVATGSLEDGTAFLLQEYVAGERIGTLDAPTMNAILDANARQSGLADVDAVDDSQQLQAVLAGNCSWKAAVRDNSPAGSELVRHGDEVVADLGSADLPVSDVVHGDYSTANMIIAPDGTIRFLDCETVGRGTRVRDLADLYRQCFVYPGTSPTVMTLLRERACAIAGPAVFGTCAVAVSYNNLAWWAENRTAAEFDGACAHVQLLFDDLQGRRETV